MRHRNATEWTPAKEDYKVVPACWHVIPCTTHLVCNGDGNGHTQCVLHAGDRGGVAECIPCFVKRRLGLDLTKTTRGRKVQDWHDRHGLGGGE